MTEKIQLDLTSDALGGAIGAALLQSIEPKQRDLLIAQAIHDRHNWRCFYCGVEVKTRSTRKTLPNLDHVVPLSRGGDHSEENLITCCGSCNSRKGTKTLEEFRVYASRNLRAAMLMEEALNLCATPFDGCVQQAISWLNGQGVRPFYGETL
jgi:hypothetical protein